MKSITLVYYLHNVLMVSANVLTVRALPVLALLKTV